MNQNMPLKCCAVGIVFALVFLVQSGCRPSLTKPFVSPELRGGADLKMAILPFDNLSNAQGAGKTMESLILIEFLKRSSVKIVDPGEVSAVLSKERIRLATSISKETIRSLGADLGVGLLMIGAVHQYDTQITGGASGSGAVPVAAVTLRIIDAMTGDIVWASNAVRRGNDREMIFGIGKIQSLNALAEATAAELAQAFADSLGKKK